MAPVTSAREASRVFSVRAPPGLVLSLLVGLLFPTLLRAVEPGEGVFVPTRGVGFPGNAPESVETVEGVEGLGPRGELLALGRHRSLIDVGAVDYEYRVGVFPVSVSQYAAFLNAVAAADDYGDGSELWVGGMADGGIDRTGRPGRYRYEVQAGSGNLPIFFTSYMNAVRFANWLHNGQPRGARGPETTEAGSYDLGVTPPARTPEATWVVPTEDEWYKAAYYSPVYGGPGAPGYYDYATRSDRAPRPSPPTDGSNAANYLGAVGGFTPGAAYPQSRSYFGTVGQTGNCWEWIARFGAGCAMSRGGSYASTEITASSAYVHVVCLPGIGLDTRTSTNGFRLVRLLPKLG